MQENKVSDKIEVLLVDDRPENLLALETVLESPEYKLVKANSGDEALRYLLDHEPALILLDVQMPDLDGFETATLIKRSERTRSIPIIFVTALNQDDRYVLKGYQHGAIDYLYKPFDPNILRSKVAVFAELARKTRSLILAERKISEAEKKDRERQIAQLELRSLKREQLEQKKYLDLVAGITHGIVWSVDSDSMSTSFVSPSSLKILGYAESDWLDDQDFFLNLIPPADRKFFNDAIDRAKLSNESEKLEHRFVTHEGNELWFQTELKLAHKTDSSGYEIRGISMDITRMKEVQEMLETAVKVRDEFLSVASHELKTPLTPLKLQAQMLGRVLKAANGAELKSEKVDKILVTFDRQIDRLSLLIDELLDISKMTNGKLSVSFEEFDLIECIHDILNRFSQQLINANCDITFAAKGELRVNWDRFRIEQILVNLLTNAAKYGHGKPIHIQVFQDQQNVSVSFKDHGIGIAKPDLHRIFERFERAVSGKNFSGLGLGLYIVTQLLEAHHGKIQVESELGAGSKFTITIPKVVPLKLPVEVLKRPKELRA